MNFKTAIFLAALEVLAMVCVSALGASSETDAEETPGLAQEPTYKEQKVNSTDDDKQMLQFCLGRPCHRNTNHQSSDSCCNGHRCRIHWLYEGFCIRVDSDKDEEGNPITAEASPAVPTNATVEANDQRNNTTIELKY